ncbi:MAG: hemerythrin family protein [Pseudomonadota bacterium]|nr:hemerythrin family protein [Pseudomonadota bacterium]
MDETHREFFEHIRALGDADEGAIGTALSEIEAHCERHFATEEGLMLDSDYPSTDCHTQEHAAVLASVREVSQWWQPGSDAETVRRLAAALSTWFETHTAYLDSALAQWLVKRQYGGVPVVVRRTSASSSSDGRHLHAD